MTSQRDHSSSADSEFPFAYQAGVVWLTGLPGAGKSTLARALEDRLREHRVACLVLDGDSVRRGLCSDLGYSREDRGENIRRVGEAARLFAKENFIVIAALISPYRLDREKVRGRIGPGRFIEVYVDCPLAECERRDPKGLYRQARQGQIEKFTGISDPYEPPLRPEIHLRTDRVTVQEGVAEIMAFLSGRDLLHPHSSISDER